MRIVHLILGLFVLLCVTCRPYTPVYAPATTAPRECSVEGTWRGMVRGGVLAGRMVDLTFYQNHVARGTSGAIMLEVEWHVDGNVLSITHRDSIPEAARCPVDVVGTYNVAFSPDCSSVTATSITDLCEHRRRTLDQLEGHRQ
jgi:hypothetical protein